MRSFITALVTATSLSGCMFVFDRDPPGGDPPTYPESVPPDAPSGPNYAALCDAPDGPALTLTSAELVATLSGKWWRCGGADEFRGKNVEFSSDLNFYLLTEVNGAYVRNLGPSSSGTFTVLDRMGIDIAIETQWGDGLSPDYPLVGYITSSPRKMQLGGGRYVRMQ